MAASGDLYKEIKLGSVERGKINENIKPIIN